ncbi:CPBP family intramembrane glutamic endopeptidase [Lactobacillus intestinalis]|uniref:CPBP family intramembrane glutamic endopeptidase n=1 Tax=Lactobacillus intestinalis TaxID=151781 RepID=UPI0025AA0FA2|nr:type II CAAX endopeptidase family protein [Lactobacillus intestinalis]
MKRARTNLQVIKNYVIIFLSFAVLSIGLILLAQYLMAINLLSNNLSWVFILLRYIIAVVGLLYINRKIIKSKLLFKFQKDKASYLGSMVVLIFTIYNLWGLNGGFYLNTNTQKENFLFCLGPAIFEELLFRGIIFNRLCEINKTRKLGLYISIFLSAFLFMISHLLIPDYSNLIDLFWQCMIAFGLGVLFATIYFVTQNLALTMIMHFANNLNSYFFLGGVPILANLSTLEVNLISLTVYFLISFLLLLLKKKQKNQSWKILS